MLVLARKVGQSIIINENIELLVLEVRGDQVRLGIEAPRNIPVHR
ncbi:MAG: carbon storage regulator, partial [Armatimonadota bacterium]